MSLIFGSFFGKSQKKARHKQSCGACNSPTLAAGGDFGFGAGAGAERRKINQLKPPAKPMKKEPLRYFRGANIQLFFIDFQ